MAQNVSVSKLYDFWRPDTVRSTVLCFNLDCFTSLVLVQCMVCKNKQDYSTRQLTILAYCIKHHFEIKRYLHSNIFTIEIICFYSRWAKYIEHIHFISLFLQFFIGNFVDVYVSVWNIIGNKCKHAI